MNNDLYIQSLIDEAMELLSSMKINYTTKAGNNTRALIEVLIELYPLIKDDYPVISNILESVSKNLIRDNGCINAYSFGDMVKYKSASKNRYKYCIPEIATVYLFLGSRVLTRIISYRCVSSK